MAWLFKTVMPFGKPMGVTLLTSHIILVFPLNKGIFCPVRPAKQTRVTTAWQRTSPDNITIKNINKIIYEKSPRQIGGFF
jgi:hypothetical protein